MSRPAVFVTMVLAFAAGCSKPSGPMGGDEVVLATIDGRDVPRGLYDAYLHDNFSANIDGGNLTPSKLDDNVSSRLFDAFLDEQILVSRARAAGVTVSDEELAAYVAELGLGQLDQLHEGLTFVERQWLRRYLTDCLAVKKFLAVHVTQDLEVSDEDARARYDADLVVWYIQPRYRIRRIRVDAQELAEELAKQLKPDGSNFDALVTGLKAPSGEDESEDEDQGRDLGFWRPDQLPDNFARALATLAPGQATPPLEDPEGGYNILQLVDKNAGRQQEFDEVKDKIRTQLKRDRGAQRVDDYLARERSRAKVEIHNENLGFAYASPTPVPARTAVNSAGEADHS